MAEKIIEYPPHWTPRFAGHFVPCDVIQGMCVCGRFHSLNDDWVKDEIATNGLKPGSQDIDDNIKERINANLRGVFG